MVGLTTPDTRRRAPLVAFFEVPKKSTAPTEESPVISIW
jgi:hypothetical protein